MTQPRTKRPSWSELPPTNWAENQAYRIAGEITRLRGKNSAQWLADRTKGIGYEVSRSVISDLENGRRRYVTTAELLVIAAALNVSPVTLVYPGPYQSKIELLPGNERTEFVAAQWFSGESHWDEIYSGKEWVDSVDALASWRLLDNLIRTRQEVMHVVPVTDLTASQITFYDKEIRRVRYQLGLSDDA